MNNTKKKKMLNVMNATAQAVKLGDSLPAIFVKKPIASEISSSKTTVNVDCDFDAVMSATVIGESGIYRVVSKTAKTDAGNIEVTASGMQAGDTVCVTVI